MCRSETHDTSRVTFCFVFIHLLTTLCIARTMNSVTLSSFSPLNYSSADSRFPHTTLLPDSTSPSFIIALPFLQTPLATTTDVTKPPSSTACAHLPNEDDIYLTVAAVLPSSYLNAHSLLFYFMYISDSLPLNPFGLLTFASRLCHACVATAFHFPSIHGAELSVSRSFPTSVDLLSAASFSMVCALFGFQFSSSLFFFSVVHFTGSAGIVIDFAFNARCMHIDNCLIPEFGRSESDFTRMYAAT
jgi:hypothetical protein